MNRTRLIIKSSKYNFFNTKSACVECLKVFDSTTYKMHRSWGSQSSDYDVNALLGCSTMWSSKSSLTFWENVHSHLHGQRLSQATNQHEPGSKQGLPGLPFDPEDRSNPIIWKVRELILHHIALHIRRKWSLAYKIYFISNNKQKQKCYALPN